MFKAITLLVFFPLQKPGVWLFFRVGAFANLALRTSKMEKPHSRPCAQHDSFSSRAPRSFSSAQGRSERQIVLSVASFHLKAGAIGVWSCANRSGSCKLVRLPASCTSCDKLCGHHARGVLDRNTGPCNW